MRSQSLIYTNKEDMNSFIKSYSFNPENQMLIQIFSGVVDKELIQRIIDEVSSLLPEAKIIGTTTAGGIYKGRLIEGSCLISFTEFNCSTIEIYNFHGKSRKITQDMKEMKLLKQPKDTKAIISFFSIDDIHVSEMIDFMSFDTNIIVAGGAAGTPEWGEDIPLTYVFSKDNILQEGIVFAVLKGDNLTAYNGSSFGVVPIGREYEITDSTGSMIHQIEGKKAKEFYESHIGRKATYDLCVQFPVTFLRNNVVTSSPVFIFENTDSILLTTELKPGDKIRFGFGNKVDVIDDNRQVSEYLSNKNIEAMFLYSCTGRKQLLKELIDEDTKPLNDIQEANGAFLFGQFYHINNHNNIYAQTLTVLALTENAYIKKYPGKIISSNKLFKDDEEEVLHHFLKSTGEELNFLTNNLEKKVVEKTKELRESYLTDNLTKLKNRIKFTRDIKLMIDPDIAFIRIKDFSNLNSFYGVSIMDKLLIEIANRLSTTQFRERIYSIDSSTFAITGSNVQEEDFKQIQSSLNNRPFKIGGINLQIDTIMVSARGSKSVLEKSSVGFDFCRQNNISFLDYEKEDDLLKKAAENLIMIEKLKEAISEDRIEPYYQPIVDNITGETVKYESLMRMIDKTGKVISPFFFLDIAIHAGFYSQLSAIMINKTFETFKDKSYDFSINLIYEDIINPETVELIKSCLSNKKTAKRSVFEIVESESIEDYSIVRSFIDQIKSYGAKIAIDDFGTGYSNFMYLIQLNVDFVKIDGSIMKHIHKDENSYKVAKSIVDFAKIMNAETIGEFIEDEEVYKSAVNLGVNYSQGYFFSPPVSRQKLI